MENKKVEASSGDFWRAVIRSKGLWRGDIWIRWSGILLVYFTAPMLGGNSSRALQATILGITGAIGLFYALLFFMRHETGQADTLIARELNDLPVEGAYAEHLAGTMVFFGMLMYFLVTQ